MVKQINHEKYKRMQSQVKIKKVQAFAKKGTIHIIYCVRVGMEDDPEKVEKGMN